MVKTPRNVTVRRGRKKLGTIIENLKNNQATTSENTLDKTSQSDPMTKQEPRTPSPQELIQIHAKCQKELTEEVKRKFCSYQDFISCNDEITKMFWKTLMQQILLDSMKSN